jgi:hypothetical protein
VPILAVRFGKYRHWQRARRLLCGSPIHYRIPAQDASDQLEVAVDIKGSRIALLIIIVATLVCVAGVLILPQVDLPDFVLNGSKAPTITAVHGKLSLSSSGVGYLDILNSVLVTRRFHQSGPIVGDVRGFGSDTFLSLRC